LTQTSLSVEERYQAESQNSSGGMQLAVAGIATPGLQNNAGEYNCFLNCILQCLWNCKELRPTILSWQPYQVQVSLSLLCPREVWATFGGDVGVDMWAFLKSV